MKYALTLFCDSDRCGSSEPGTAASASRNSSTIAVRIAVSRRHQLQQPGGDPAAADGRAGGFGASRPAAVQ